MVLFLGPYYNTGPNLGDPKRDHNFDNPPIERDQDTSGDGKLDLMEPLGR